MTIKPKAKRSFPARHRGHTRFQLMVTADLVSYMQTHEITSHLVRLLFRGGRVFKHAPQTPVPSA